MERTATKRNGGTHERQRTRRQPRHLLRPGHYWLSDGDASMDLGECSDLGDLAYAVAQCIQSGDADWSGWEVTKG